MKSIICRAVLAPVVMAATLTASAATVQTTIEVPFSFSVGSIDCPAGAYSIESTLNDAFVMLKRIDGPQSFVWLLSAGDLIPTDTRIVMRFDERGQTHILRSVQYRSLITTRLDKNAQRSKHESDVISQEK